MSRLLKLIPNGVNDTRNISLPTYSCCLALLATHIIRSIRHDSLSISIIPPSVIV